MNSQVELMEIQSRDRIRSSVVSSMPLEVLALKNLRGHTLQQKLCKELVCSMDINIASGIDILKIINMTQA